MSFVLRHYQEKGVGDIRLAMKSGVKSTLFVLPTGGGKTAIFSHIAKGCISGNWGCLILVHRHELLLQSSQSLGRLGLAHGMISPKFPASNHLAQVGSVQTVSRRLDKIKPPNLLIIDESHHGTSVSYRNIIRAFPQAYILGVTATPERADGKGLGVSAGGIFQQMIVGPSVSELIGMNFLVKPRVFAPPVGIDVSNVRKIAGDFAKDELKEKVDKRAITGNVIEHYRRLANNQPAVVFCVSIDHAMNVADEFKRAGYRACHVDGGMTAAERAYALDGLRDGHMDIVTSADLIGEGVDIPRCSVAILLRPTYSLPLFLQQCGRALRPYPGKTSALILDHVGNTLRHGFPDSVREWSLDGAAGLGSRNSSDDNEVKITQCRKCFFVFETGPEVCPQCGAAVEIKERKIEQVEGELRELREADLQLKKTKRKEQGMLKTEAELFAHFKKLGHKNPAWRAKMVFDGRKRKK